MARPRVAFTWQDLTDQRPPDDVTARPFLAANTESRPAQGRTGRGRRRLWWGMLGLALVVALVAGYRLYRTAEAGVAVLEAELRDAILLDSYATANPMPAAQQTPTALQSFDLRNGVAAVAVVVHDAARPLPYRETRFYQQTAHGWQLAAADARFWGPRQQLESEHFVFTYHRRDAAAVAVAAPALDALYTRLHQYLGLTLPNADVKVSVEVDASHQPAAHGLPTATAAALRVPSPDLLQLPLGVSGADVLALSVSLALVDRLLHEVGTDRAANGNLAAPTDWWWSPLAAGLRLWLLWDNDPLLAGWRQAVLTWHVANVCRSCARPPLPADYQEFCQLFTALGAQPQDLFSIPCPDSPLYGLDTYFFLSPPLPPAYLSSLASPLPVALPDASVASLLRMTYGGQVVSMATLLEYVASHYGREQIPVLLGAFDAYERWDTLVPAVFGKSAAEFDADWRTYLSEQYAVAAP